MKNAILNFGHNKKHTIKFTTVIKRQFILLVLEIFFKIFCNNQMTYVVNNHLLYL